MRNSFNIPVRAIGGSFLVLFFALIFVGCIEVDNKYNKLAPGIWRATLELVPHEPMAMKKKDVKRVTEDFAEGDLPFNFEVKYTDADHFYVELINGTERIRCDSIRFWRMKNSAYDTLVIAFPHYQSYLRAVVRERLMEGEFVVTSKENYRIPFRAKNGISYRFTNMNTKPNSDLTGKWETTFGINDKIPEKAVGEFIQKGNNLTGTWRTETGDYRFLDGTIQGRKFWLSAFDGAHAFLFSGNIKGDTLTGEMRSGTHFQTLWTAKRNENFDIRPADNLTKLKSGATGIHFAYKTPEGRDVRMPDPAQKGKVKIVQIMGSWCPNCLDETEFLVDYFKKNPTEKVQVIGLSWERGHNIKLGNEQVARYKKLKNIPYDLVYAGYSSIDSVKVVLPELDNLMAFPTMILIDKNDKVRQIHTGFDGPASSKNAAFKADFDKNLKLLLAE